MIDDADLKNLQSRKLNRHHKHPAVADALYRASAAISANRPKRRNHLNRTERPKAGRSRPPPRGDQAAKPHLLERDLCAKTMKVLVILALEMRDSDGTWGCGTRGRAGFHPRQDDPGGAMMPLDFPPASTQDGIEPMG